MVVVELVVVGEREGRERERDTQHIIILSPQLCPFLKYLVMFVL